MPRKQPAPKRPTRLSLGYTDIRVVVREMEDLHGDYSSVLKRVTLAKDSAAGPEGVNTLLHELLHTGYDLGQLRNPELSTEQAKADEERVVTVLANNLTELFRRNPRLLKWIESELGNR